MEKICNNCDRTYKTDNKRRKYCCFKCYKKMSPKTENRGRFKRGQKPWNKGLKGIHLSSKTEFKKGQKPKNKKMVGSITIRITKNKTRRRFIKVAEPNKWINYCNYIWIKFGGSIPKGFYLHHINGDPLDDRIENLSLVTRKTHINLHRKELSDGKNRIKSRIQINGT